MCSNWKQINHLVNTVAILNDEIERLQCCDRSYVLRKRLSYALKLQCLLPRRMGACRERLKTLREQKKLEHIDFMIKFDKQYNISSIEKEMSEKDSWFPEYLKYSIF